MDLPLRIVLVETSHPGNIGAVARAMKNMCLGDLALVRPLHFPHADATTRAAGADELLTRARVCDTLEEALADCRWVAGASARLRSLAWPVLNPRDCAARAVAEAAEGPAALVFGREKSGLTNDELAHCQALVHVPANPEFSSLNLAMAVQVLAYELHVAAGADVPPPGREEPLATGEELDYFYAHLERALIGAGFLNPENPRHLMLRLRRLFNRAEPDQNEMNILRGILSALAPGSGRDPGAGEEIET